MSTKIYNAYKNTSVHSAQDVAKVLDTLKELRKSCQKLISQYIFDSLKWESQPDFIKIVDAVRDDCKSCEHRLFNFESSAVLYLHPEIEGAVVQLFVDGALRNLELSSPWKDWHYQNQTDQPEEISDEEWAQREKEWELLLPGIGVPSLAGLSFPLFSHTSLDHYDVVRTAFEKAKEQGLLSPKE